MNFRIVLFVSLFYALSAAANSKSSVSDDALHTDVIRRVALDMCDKDVVLLGEGPEHGYAKTNTFKVTLVRRLIETCAFDTVLFEASYYEFVDLARNVEAGDGVTSQRLANAIGGLWKFDYEFQPLIPYLASKAEAGEIVLGGLDDQIGGFEQQYANNVLPTELANRLPSRKKDFCVDLLRRRIYQDFPKEMPYSPLQKGALLRCPDHVLRITKSEDRENGERHSWNVEMVSSLRRLIERDHLPPEMRYRLWDKSMFANFVSQTYRLKRSKKIIVWGSTMHMAKDARAIARFNGADNFGTLVYRKYGRRLFSLGFSALSGTIRINSRSSKLLPKAPSNSMEAFALSAANQDIAYLDEKALRALGAVPGAAFRHEYQVAAWAKALNGIVIFREERPAQNTRK